LDHLATKKEPLLNNKFLNKDIFGMPDENKIRFKKPLQRTVEKKPQRNISKAPPPAASKNLKKLSDAVGNPNLFDDQMVKGNIVEHAKFGRGEVMFLEGSGNSRKAEIKFETGDTKKLLLQFAKLKIIG